MFTFVDTRYSRQEQMPEWGSEKQEQLTRARVAIIGAGGVKSTTLLCLAAAGVGYLRIIDFDTIELSNLNRQILYRTHEIGLPKAVAAKNTLIELNPEIVIDAHTVKVDDNNIADLCGDCDYIIEGGESPWGRNLVNEYCLSKSKPFTHASAQFNYGYLFSVVPKSSTACFACFFPDDHFRREHTGPVPVSVLSTSVAGSLCAAEALKWFMGYQDYMFLNRRLRFSSLLLSAEFDTELQPRLLDCPVCSRYYMVSTA